MWKLYLYTCIHIIQDLTEKRFQGRLNVKKYLQHGLKLFCLEDGNIAVSENIVLQTDFLRATKTFQ